jgi:hypothetical protein
VRCCYTFYKVGCIQVCAQIFIKAVKSFNGTFINGELSPEGLGSEPYKLKSDDIVVCIPVQTRLSLETHFSSDSVRNSESTSSAKTKRLSTTIKPSLRPLRMHIFRTRYAGRCTRRTTTAETPRPTRRHKPTRFPVHYLLRSRRTSLQFEQQLLFSFARGGSDKIARRPLMQAHGL